LQIRTKEFALRIVRMFAALPRSTEAQVLGKQVLRSGTSVGAIYREANRARSKPEFIAKIGDCLKELDETAYEHAFDGDIDEWSYRSVESALDELAALSRGEAQGMYSQFRDRLVRVEQMTSGIGWGFHDFVGDVVEQLEKELGNR